MIRETPEKHIKPERDRSLEDSRPDPGRPESCFFLETVFSDSWHLFWPGFSQKKKSHGEGRSLGSVDRNEMPKMCEEPKGVPHSDLKLRNFLTKIKMAASFGKSRYLVAGA